jgi:hypothetical protein
MKLFKSGKLKGMYTGPDKGGMGNSKKTKAIPMPKIKSTSKTKMPRVKSETESEKKLRLMKSASKRANKGMSKLLAGRGRKKGPSGRK